jgi:hypothetical protein
MNLREELVKRGLWNENDPRDPSTDRQAYVIMTSCFTTNFLDKCCYAFGQDQNCQSANLNHARYHLVLNIIKTYDSIPNKTEPCVYSLV